MDIVEWLTRAQTQFEAAFGKSENGPRYGEAADEIERLSAHASDFHHDICCENDNLRAENDNLRAEIERMKAALAEMLVEFIAAHKEGHISTFPRAARRIIRQAEALLSPQR